MYQWHRQIQAMVDETDQCIKMHDSKREFPEIALDYDFSSHEAVTRALRKLYGVTPGRYRWCCAQRYTPLTAAFPELERLVW